MATPSPTPEFGFVPETRRAGALACAGPPGPALRTLLLNPPPNNPLALRLASFLQMPVNPPMSPQPIGFVPSTRIIRRRSHIMNQSFRTTNLQLACDVQEWGLSHHTGGFSMAKGCVAISVERCKGCGFCVEFCPTHVLALSSAFNSKGYHPPHVVAGEKCSGCDLCGMYCPDFAIFGAKRHAS